ncbi:hypothetical protein F5Y06DRAFT_302061 [Hypoxylon sp. FL0890]|nr:hypothetical protein F5Y06DRAFT_302061 [Hypoxylon sp. FL0890]
MCLYQDIHAAYHYELLGFDATERESHVCEYEILSPEKETGHSENKKCPLHSCCRVLSRDVIFRCQAARGEEQVCELALGEVVFVPLSARHRNGDMTNRRVDFRVTKQVCTGGEGEKAHPRVDLNGNTNRAAIDRDELPNEPSSQMLPVPTMEFWPDDEPGRIVTIFLKDEAIREEGQGSSQDVWDEMLCCLRWRS